MWTWVLIIVAYAAGMFAFQLLGGIAAAGRAFENWGRASSARRVERSGLGARGFANARLGKTARRDSGSQELDDSSPS
jgi:hypothetical protein